MLPIVIGKDELGQRGFNPHLLARFDLAAYREYRLRLDSFVRERPSPLLVFCSSGYEPTSREWVQATRPSGVTAFVETPPGDPQPLLEEVSGTAERWLWLADRLRPAGVRCISLVGEAAFTQDGGRERLGCVWEAWHRLRAHFRTEIVRDVTYPNLDVPSPPRR